MRQLLGPAGGSATGGRDKWVKGPVQSGPVEVDPLLSLVLTFGAPDGGTSSGAADTLRWTPAAGTVDRAGNALPTTARNETGPVDVDF